MDEQNTSILAENCALLASHTLPRWNELPDLELYMDQVLGLIGRYLGAYPGFDGKGLTASMVNNYVKLGVMPAPVKKKYTRTHLAHLVVICLLKPCLPIASIQRLVAHELEDASEAEVYDRFCSTFERTNRAAAEMALAEADKHSTPLFPLYHAALLAQAEQALALRLYAAFFPAEEKVKSDRGG